MRCFGLLVSVALAAATSAAAQAPVYSWMGGSGDGDTSLSYGSPETAEDQLFWIVCRRNEKKTEMVVYVDMTGIKVGQPVVIELSSGAGKTVVNGEAATDEMSGFIFARAEQFPVKPVIELLAAKGPVTIKTGEIVTKLPDKGRAPELAKFTKGC
ncbi:MAG TPA: hypothetical protein VJK06_00990, partial [Methyloceanibacter sp.]|nr:hypothetical protein [Methyloceanibacter sp.]